MYLSKLIKLLKSFEPAELKQLQKFAHSPYFQIYTPSVALLDYVLPLYPDFLPKKMSIAAIAQKHPSLTTRSKQETAASRLQVAVKKFMAIEELQKNTADVKRSRLRQMQTRGLHEEFEKGWHKEMQHLDNCPEQNIETFSNRHLLTELSLTGFEAKLHRTSQNNIMPVVETLDAYYAIKKLRYLCEALNRRRFFGIALNGHERHIPMMLEILAPYTNEKYPYVYLFVNVCCMLSANSFEESEVPYRLIQQFIEKQKGTLLPGIVEAVNYANSHCLYWFNKGHEKAGDEYLWWTEIKIKHHLLFENGKLLPVYFRNIISIAVLNNKNPEWIQNIIATYAPRLPEEQYDTYLAFGRGLYQYTQRNYREAIRYFLIAQEREEVSFNCVIRRWQWICYYEFDANDTETLHIQLVAFVRYLERNQKEVQHLSAVFYLFISYATKLLNSVTVENLKENLAQLQSEEHFAGKPWLKEQFLLKNKKPVRYAHG